MNQTDCNSNLELYVLDALPPEERAVVEAHLRNCAACRDEAAGLRDLTGQLRAAADGGAVPPALRQRLHREIWLARLRERMWAQHPVWLRAAALMAVVLGLGYTGRAAWVNRRGAADGGAPWTQAGFCA